MNLRIDGTRIAAMAPDLTPVPGEAVFSAHGRLLLPGLVDAHTHSNDHLLRSMGQDLPLELWSLRTSAARIGRSAHEVYVGALLGCIEYLQHGITTVLDHLKLDPMSEEGFAAAARAYADAGIRGIVAPILQDLPLAATVPVTPGPNAFARRSPLPAAEQLAMTDAFVARWGGAVGPSAPHRCSDALLAGCADLARRRGVPLQLHVLETRLQRDTAARPTLERLEALGCLGPSTSLVHAVWLARGDVERIAASGASVVHCPLANAKLGSGLAPIVALVENGVNVALGTDSAACGDAHDLWTAMRFALLSPRSALPHHRWLGAAAGWRMATEAGARALGVGGAGRLAVGAPADIVLLDLDRPAFVPLTDPVAQLVFAAGPAAVREVFAGGRLVLKDGWPTGFDAKALLTEAAQLGARRLALNRPWLESAWELAAQLEHRLGSDGGG